MLNIGILSEGAFTPFDGFSARLAILTDGAFTPFVEIPIVITPFGGVRKSTTVLKFIWTPKREIVFVTFEAWEEVKFKKSFWFGAWVKKSNQQELLYSVFKGGHKVFSLLFNVSNIYIFENLGSSFEIKNVSHSVTVLENRDLGWVIINDN